MSDWKYLEQRNMERLSPQEKELFLQHSVKLCAYNKDFISFNVRKCEELGNPVALVTAENRPPKAKSTAANSAGSLINNLILTKGQKIVLKKNLWADAGLINGSIGYIHDIIFSPDRSPPKLPDLLLCRFDSYLGPSYLDNVEKIIPLSPFTYTWITKEKNSFSRTQFPIHPGDSFSIHGSQGQTVPRAIINLGGPESWCK